MAKQNTKLRKEVLLNRKIIAISLLLIIAISAVMILFLLDIKLPKFSFNGSSKITYTNQSSVYLPEEYLSILNARYNSDRSEFIYCFYGEEYQDGFLIESMKETKVFQYNESSILYEPCRRTNDFLGTIHSHPQPEDSRYVASCDLSKQDIYTFGAEDMPLTGIICGENEIAIYSSEKFNLEDSLTIQVIQK